MWIVEDLEWSIDIVELVKRYTNIKKAWANYKALCPFPGHTEHTPSFVISPSKQIAHCFGCHRWWGPIKFIMDIENCNFKEAIEILSNITWVKIKWYDMEKEKIKQNIYTVFKDVVRYYKSSLLKHTDILKYLYDRWLNQESINNFDFWYSDSWVELYWYLKEKWYSDELISQTNIFLDLKTKKDKFIARVIFPIKNIRWDIVWLAWRIIENWEPKYLNSPASDIYDKSNILYWLYDARSEITKKDFVIITEWYMDTISLHQAGFKNTVCVSWIALTEKHIITIKKLTKKIYLCFDNDKAWINATNLSIEMLKNKDIELKIISLEWAKDPDEVIKSWVDFNIFLNNALTPIWYNLHLLSKTDSLNDKKEMLKKLLELVKNYHDNVEKDYYLKEISKKLDIKLEIVYLEYNKTRAERQENNFVIDVKKLTSQELLIGLILKYPEKIDFVNENLITKKYLIDDLKAIIENWVEIINTFDLDKKNKYLSITQNDEILEIKAQIENSIVKNNDKIESDILKTIDKLNKDILKELKEKLSLWDTWVFEDYTMLLKIKK